MKAELFIFR